MVPVASESIKNHKTMSYIKYDCAKGRLINLEIDSKKRRQRSEVLGNVVLF